MESIWKEVLDLDRVGLDDSFFDLGGNSLLSHELSIRLSAALQKSVSTINIFSHPNIRTLARLLGDVDQNKSKESALQAQSRSAKQRGVYNSGRRASRQRMKL
jgi:nonribosomal peptide synthetase DhbF